MLSSKTAVLALCSFVTLGHAIQAAVVGVTSVTVGNGNPSNINSDDTNLVSITVPSGTYGNLSAASSSSGYALTDGGEIQNIWGQSGTEVDGLDAMLNLDLSRSIVNGGDGANLDIMFGSTLLPNGALGAGNDIFLFEVGRYDYQSPIYNDNIVISALDITGSVIGNHTISMPETIWGDRGKDLHGVDEAGNTPEWHILGLGLDLTDCDSSGYLPGVAGICINVSGGIDLISVGFNTEAVPEPASGTLLLGLMLLGLKRSRIRR